MAEERKVLELMGAPGSPYTRKMLAVMRFRNIPYRLERQSRMVEALSELSAESRLDIEAARTAAKISALIPWGMYSRTKVGTMKSGFPSGIIAMASGRMTNTAPTASPIKT